MTVSLAELRDAGILTPEEFAEQKRKILTGGSALPQVESPPDAIVTPTSKDRLQQAYDRYDRLDIDGALDLFKTIILDDTSSPEAEAAKTKIKKIYVAKELLEKAFDLHDKTNFLIKNSCQEISYT